MSAIPETRATLITADPDLRDTQNLNALQLPVIDSTCNDESHDQQKHASEKNIFKVSNKYVQKARDNREPDFLYHLGLVVSVEQTSQIFHDIEYVCVGGTPSRMQEFAVICLAALDIKVPAGLAVTDLCGGHARYVMYKAGPVLTVSHGMGNPSLSIMLHEVFKLLHYAQAGKDVKFFRIGTCGGVGVPGGTTIISDRVYNGIHESFYEQFILGHQVRRPAVLDSKLAQDLYYHATKPGVDVPVVLGNTMCADDFYEEQARIDGAFCDFTNEERIEFLEKCYHTYGIRNFEMESLAFAAMTHQAGFKAAVVCVALVNRLESDKITQSVDMELWTRRPQRVVVELIRSELMDGPAGRKISLDHLRKDLDSLNIIANTSPTGRPSAGGSTKGAIEPTATSTIGILPAGSSRPLDPSAAAVNMASK